MRAGCGPTVTPSLMRSDKRYRAVLTHHPGRVEEKAMNKNNNNPTPAQLGIAPGAAVVLGGDETPRAYTFRGMDPDRSIGAAAAVVEVCPGLEYVVNPDRLALDDEMLRGLVETAAATVRTSDRVQVASLKGRADLPGYLRSHWELKLDGRHVGTYKTKKAATSAAVLAVAVAEWRAVAAVRGGGAL